MCTRRSLDDFKRKVRKVHGDRYDLSVTEYHNAHTKVSILCKVHGMFEITPNKLIHAGQGCPTCFKLRNLDSDLDLIKSLEAQEYTVNYSHLNPLADGFKASDKVFQGCPHWIREVSFRKIREGATSCSKCTHSKSWEDWLVDFEKIYNGLYEYIAPKNPKIINSKTKINIICDLHGKFTKSLIKHREQGCPSCSKQNLKPLTKTLVNRNEDFYKNQRCYLYLLRLNAVTYKIGISINPAQRLSNIRRELKGTEYSPETLHLWETDTYTAVHIEEDVYKQIGLKPSTDLYEKFAGYTETFIDKDSLLLKKVVEEINKMLAYKEI